MLIRKTALIVGAGASAEISLPTGAQLIQKIASMLDFQLDDWGDKLQKGDRHIFNALKIKCQNEKLNLQQYFDAARQISEGIHYAFSIDNYIDIHQSSQFTETCGKLSIAKSILEAEKSSSIFIDQMRGSSRLSAQSVSNTWYHRLLQILHTGVIRENFESIFDNILIISFNYDRCIEHFLVNALQPVYGLTQNEAETVVRKLKIYHPYGQVGYLPWQNSSMTKIPFGHDVSPQQMTQIASSLKTFTEKVTDVAARDEMQEALSESETIIFLGFGYYEQNMRLIRPKYPANVTRFFGTVYGVSSPDVSVIQKQLDDFSGKSIDKQLIGTKCVGLFDNYWRNLSS